MQPATSAHGQKTNTGNHGETAVLGGIGGQKRRRGRPRQTYVPKETPSTKVLRALDENSVLSYSQLLAATGLTEDKLGLALTSVMLNSRQVYSFNRGETRFYSKTIAAK